MTRLVLVPPPYDPEENNVASESIVSRDCTSLLVAVFFLATEFLSTSVLHRRITHVTQHELTANRKPARLLWMLRLTALNSIGCLVLEGPVISGHHHQREPSNRTLLQPVY